MRNLYFFTNSDFQKQSFENQNLLGSTNSLDFSEGGRKPKAFNYLISKASFLIGLVCLIFIFSGVNAQIASAPSNLKSPWVNGTYTNLAVSSTNNSSLLPPRVVTVSNTANVINASTTEKRNKINE